MPKFNYTAYMEENNYAGKSRAEQDKLRNQFVAKNVLPDIRDFSQGERVNIIDKALVDLKKLEANNDVGPMLPTKETPSRIEERKKDFKLQVEGQKATTFEGFKEKFSETKDSNTEVIQYTQNMPWYLKALIPQVSATGVSAPMAMGAGDAVKRIGEARYKQAEAYSLANQTTELPASSFPDVIVAEGLKQSAVPRLAKSIANIEMLDPKYTHEKDSTAGFLLSSAGTLGGDLPLFMVGPAAARAIIGFSATHSANAIADTIDDIRKKNRDFGINDVLHVAKETGKGAIMGSVLTLVGAGGSKLFKYGERDLARSFMQAGLADAEKIAARGFKLLENVSMAPVEGIALSGANAILSGQKITSDEVMKNIMLAGVMRAKHLLMKTDAGGRSKYQTSLELSKTAGKLSKYVSADPQVQKQMLNKEIKRLADNGSISDVSKSTGEKQSVALENIKTIKDFQEYSDRYHKNIDSLVGGVMSSEIKKALTVPDKIVERDITAKDIADKAQSRPDLEAKYKDQFDLVDKVATENPELYKKEYRKSLEESFGRPDMNTNEGKLLNEFLDTIDGSQGRVREHLGLKENKALETTGQIVEKTYKTFDKYGNEVLETTREYKTSPAPETTADKAMISEATATDLAMKVSDKSIQSGSRIIENKFGKAMYKFLVEGMRTAGYLGKRSEAKAKKAFEKILSSNNIKAKDRDIVGEYMIAKEPLGILALKRKFGKGYKVKTEADLTPAQLEVARTAENYFQSMIETYNKVRILSGHTPIGEVENYVSFLRQFTMMEKFGLTPGSKNLKQMSDIEANLLSDPSFFSKARIYTERATEIDIGRIFNTYNNAINKHLYRMPLLAKARKLVPSFKGTPLKHDFLLKYINFMSGVPTFDPASRMIKLASALQSNVSSAYLSMNYGTVINQLGALSTSAALHPIKFMKAIPKVFSISSWKEAMNNSMHLKDRGDFIDASFNSIDGTTQRIRGYKDLYKAIPNILKTLRKGGKVPMQITDIVAAKISYDIGMDLAKSSGLKGREASRFADKLVIDWNASAAPEDISSIQRTPYGRLLTQFMTYPLNYANFLATDMLGLRIVEKPRSGRAIENDRITGATTRLGIETTKTKAEMLKNASGILLSNAIFGIGWKAMGMYNPNPDPLGAMIDPYLKELNIAYDKNQKVTKDEDVVKRVIADVAMETLQFIPYGSFAKFGGSSLPGASLNLLQDLADSISNKRDAKPALQVTMTLLGIPATSSLFKYAKNQRRLAKEEMQAMKDSKLTSEQKLNRIKKKSLEGFKKALELDKSKSKDKRWHDHVLKKWGEIYWSK